MVRISKQGSGLTESDVYHFDGELSSADEALFDKLSAEQTLAGRLASIETACTEALQSSGLPIGPGWYDRGYTNEPWPAVRHRGFAPDSREGFAARMMGDVHWIREALNVGNHERAAVLMFFLGVKWSASGIKERHSLKSRPLQPSKKQQRDIAMAREFQRRRFTSRKSDTALMAEIGGEQFRPLTRSSAIAAVKRGLEILSG